MNDKIINMDKDAAANKASSDGFVEGDSMDRFVRVFENSARRWELIVYPAMLAFVVLAAYGFFLIYTLSKDIHTVAKGMDPQMARAMRAAQERTNLIATLAKKLFILMEPGEELNITFIDQPKIVLPNRPQGQKVGVLTIGKPLHFAGVGVPMDVRAEMGIDPHTGEDVSGTESEGEETKAGNLIELP